jgi:hypothetical protein
VKPATALVEKARLGAVELVEAVENVLGSVRVDNVEQDREAHGVGSVHEALELLRRTVTARKRIQNCIST